MSEEMLIGYRSWRAIMAADGPQLGSEFRRSMLDLWQPGLNKARCEMQPPKATWDGWSTHIAPVRGCECGFYGYYQPYSEKAHNLYRSEKTLRVCGAIQATGHIVWSEYGFRSEFARILALCPPRDSHDPLEKHTSTGRGGMITERALKPIAEFYGVPCYPSYADMVRELGPTHEDQLPTHDPFDPEMIKKLGETMNAMSLHMGEQWREAITKMSEALAPLAHYSMDEFGNVTQHVTTSNGVTIANEVKDQQRQAMYEILMEKRAKLQAANKEKKPWQI